MSDRRLSALRAGTSACRAGTDLLEVALSNPPTEGPGTRAIQPGGASVKARIGPCVSVPGRLALVGPKRWLRPDLMSPLIPLTQTSACPTISPVGSFDPPGGSMVMTYDEAAPLVSSNTATCPDESGTTRPAEDFVPSGATFQI